MQTILRSFYLLRETQNEELIAVRLDMERALREAPLSEDECIVLQKRHFQDLSEGRREDLVGAPRLIHNQIRMATEALGSPTKNIQFTRLLHQAYATLAEYLGSEYQDDSPAVDPR